MFSKILLATLLSGTLGSTAIGVHTPNIDHTLSEFRTHVVTTVSNELGIDLEHYVKDEVKTKWEGKELTGTYTPTTHLNIREEPWGEVQTVLSPGAELVASREVYEDEVDWVEVTYELDGKTIVGWTSKNYLQDLEDYKYELANPTYLPNHIYYNGTSRPYKNGGYSQGQAIIDSSDYASTWGGAQVFSGYDGLSTHLIGHSHMQFQNLTDAWQFIVTDSEGNAFQYNRTAMYLVDEYGQDVYSGVELYDTITGTWGGERVIIQTTEIHPRKWIIMTEFAGQVN